jgi:hypothetical protein
MSRGSFGAEVGCYGDGALGHQHTRERCADTLAHYLDANFRSRGLPTPEGLGADDLVMALRDEMTDDAAEEHAACEWLNDHAPFEDHSWAWRDGDFGLWSDADEEPFR